MRRQLRFRIVHGVNFLWRQVRRTERGAQRISHDDGLPAQIGHGEVVRLREVETRKVRREQDVGPDGADHPGDFFAQSQIGYQGTIRESQEMNLVNAQNRGGGVLFKNDFVIFDEAHQLPEVATLFFGDTVSTAQILDLARDARSEGLTNARDCLDLQSGSKALEKVAKDLRLAVGIDAGRFSCGQLLEKPEFAPALKVLEEEVAKFAAILETQAERAEGLEKCWQRALELVQRLGHWQESLSSTSLIIAGISCIFSILAARSLRSPAISS